MLKKREIYSGEYKGIRFEINKWKIPKEVYEIMRDTDEYKYTYYIYLHLNRIPEENNPNSFWLEGEKRHGRISYDYYKHELMNEIDFHGDITWYSKETGFDNDEKIIKIGCDYSHLCDEHKIYSVDELEQDAKNTIDSFRELIPNYKYWCCGNGKLYDLKEGKIKDNRFYSEEYYGKKDFYKELPNNEIK